MTAYREHIMNKNLSPLLNSIITLMCTFCASKHVIYHRDFQSPPPEDCSNLDFGPGEARNGDPIELK